MFYINHKIRAILNFLWIMPFSKKIKEKNNNQMLLITLYAEPNKQHTYGLEMREAMQRQWQRQCWKINRLFFGSTIRMCVWHKGDEITWKTIQNVDFPFCNVTPAQHILNALFYTSPTNLCNKCHVLPFIAYPSHFSFIFFDRFSKKIHSDLLVLWKMRTA